MKNLSVYAVRYDANTDVGGGANDLSAHLQQTANNCPDTKLVVGGYSLGAGVVDTALGCPGPYKLATSSPSTIRYHPRWATTSARS